MLNGGSGNTFSNNQILNNGQYAIIGSNGFSTNTFSNNSIKGNKYGLVLQNGASTNTIKNNTFGNTTKNIDVFNGSIKNKLSQNVFIIGDTAIDLRLLSAGPGNSSKQAPTNLAVIGYRLTGKAGANDSIEIFVATASLTQTATKYLGHVKADASGNWTYNITGVDASIPNGIVTTATDASGNTSQLSAQILISSCSKIVTNTNDAGPGSLRACIECANVNGGRDTITFTMNTGTIQFSSTLPAITDDVVVQSSKNIIFDGSAIPGYPPVFVVGDVQNSDELRVEINQFNLQNVNTGVLVYKGNVTIQNGNFYNTLTGVNIANTSNVIVQKNIYEDLNGGSLININGADSIQILDNKFINGGSLVGASNPAGLKKAIIIKGNEIDSASSAGIEFDNVTAPITIVNNVIGNCGLDAIWCKWSNVSLIKGNILGLDKTMQVAAPCRSGIVISDQDDYNVPAYIDSNIIGNHRENGIFVYRGDYRISRNYIGTTPDWRDIGNAQAGINASYFLANARVGGNTIDSANYIGFNTYQGVNISNGQVLNNYIGVNPLFQNIGNENMGIEASLSVVNGNYVGFNKVHGINLSSSTARKNYVGGDGQHSFGNTLYGINVGFSSQSNENIVANNGSGGALITSTNNKVSKTLFLGTQAKAIDFFNTSSNNNKAAPTNLTVTAEYVLTGKAAADDSIEIFSATPSLAQTAIKYLGHVKADASGNWTYNITGVDASITNGIVTTATDAAGNTSPLSSQILISACTKLVTNTNDAGTGSLRACIACANLNAGTDTIKFAIPGVGPYRIKPVSEYPEIGMLLSGDSTLILGKSQAASGVGSGNQEIIIDGSLIPSVNTKPIITSINTELQNLSFMYLNYGIQLADSKVISCKIDSSQLAIVGGKFPYRARFAIIDSCEIKNSSTAIFFGDGLSPNRGGPRLLNFTNSYVYNVEYVLTGLVGGNFNVQNNIIGQDKLGNVGLVKEVTRITFANKISFINNTIKTSAAFGSAISLNTVDTILLAGNTITQVGATTSNPLIELLNNIKNIKVDNNTIENSNGAGLFVTGSLVTLINNNRIHNNQGDAILLQNSKSNTISNNILENNQSNGIDAGSNNDTLKIIGNTIVSNSSDGISLGNNQSIKIQGNSIGIKNGIASPNNGYGIYLSNAKIDSIFDNTIEYNYGGIYIESQQSAKANIYSNSFSNNVQFGCVFSNSGSYINYRNNTISNNGTTGVLLNNGSQYNTFESNIIKGNPIGIELAYGASNNTFNKNEFDNVHRSITISTGANNNKLSANTFLNADTAIYLNRNIAPGNNNKDTATISSFVQTAGYIDLFGKGLNTDTIEVFNGNGIKEQTTAYVDHAKVATGTDWTLRVPVNAGYNPVANNYYLVTATDLSNNTSQLSNFITVPLKLFSNQLNVLPKQAGICLGDSTQIDAVAENVAYYKWSNKATGAVVSSIKMPYFTHGGDYILEVGDSFGNTASDTIHIIENALPLASDFLMASEAGILDNIVAIDISYTKPDSLVWNWGAATAVWDNNKYLLTFPATGTYTIGLTSYLGMCAKQTAHDIVIVPGKLAPDVDTIYSSTIVNLTSGPNPVTTDITFTAELAYNDIVTTHIYNLLGALIYTYQTPIAARTHTYQVDMSAVASGAYIVKVLSGSDQRVIKIIKQ